MFPQHCPTNCVQDWLRTHEFVKIFAKVASRMSGAHLLNSCSAVAQLALPTEGNSNCRESPRLLLLLLLVLFLDSSFVLWLMGTKKVSWAHAPHTDDHTHICVNTYICTHTQTKIVVDLLWLHLIKTVLQCQKSERERELKREQRASLHG